MIKYHNFIFGAPITRADSRAFEQALLKRYGGDAEKATLHMERIADRQIGKSSGILSSTSILTGVSYFVHAPVALVFALITLVLTVSSFYVQWPKDTRFVEDPQTDFRRVFHVACVRAIFNSIGVFFVLLTIFSLIPYLLV